MKKTNTKAKVEKAKTTKTKKKVQPSKGVNMEKAIKAVEVSVLTEWQIKIMKKTVMENAYSALEDAPHEIKDAIRNGMSESCDEMINSINRALILEATKEQMREFFK